MSEGDRIHKKRGATLIEKLIVAVFVILFLEIAWTTLFKERKATAFQATSTDGSSISFPYAFRNKVVLLDFWATWCGPCMEEAPNIVTNYNRFHGKGFEVIGISLDDSSSINRIPEVTNEKGMDWPQVCDGHGWSSRFARMYNVHSIPQSFLIDGTSGKILAEGDDTRGDALGITLSKIYK